MLYVCSGDAAGYFDHRNRGVGSVDGRNSGVTMSVVSDTMAVLRSALCLVFPGSAKTMDVVAALVGLGDARNVQLDRIERKIEVVTSGMDRGVEASPCSGRPWNFQIRVKQNSDRRLRSSKRPLTCTSKSQAARSGPH